MPIETLHPADVARLLTDSGWKPVSAEMVRDCLEEGAPQNPDGSIDFLLFTGWLLRQAASRVD